MAQDRYTPKLRGIGTLRFSGITQYYPSSPTESRLDSDNPHIRKLFPYVVAGYPSVIRGCPGYPPVIRWLFAGYPLLFVAVSVLTIALGLGLGLVTKTKRRAQRAEWSAKDTIETILQEER